MERNGVSRRGLLALTGTTAAALAGCTQRSGAGTTEASTMTRTDTETDRGTETETEVQGDTETRSEPATDGPWPVFGADRGNTGYDPSASGPDSGNVLWQFDGGTPTMNCSPVVVGDTVYTGASGDPGGVYALDTATGEQRWGFEPEGYVTSAPAVVDRTLYVGTWARQFYAMDAESGEVLWQTDVGHRLGTSSPVVAGGTVFVGTEGDGPLVVSGPEDEEEFEAGALVALDVDTGEEQWRYDDFDERANVSSSPAYADGTVYVGGENANGSGSTLYALDAATGGVEWERNLRGHQELSPTVADGTVYYVGRPETDDPSGRLYALDEATGETAWQTPIDDVSLRSSPAIADGTVYVAASTSTACPAVGGQESTCTPSQSGTLYAIDAGNGEQRWTASIRSDVRSAPAVTGEMVYVGCNGGVSAVTRDGTASWRVELGDYLKSSPAVGGGRLFVGCSDGKLYALGDG